MLAGRRVLSDFIGREREEATNEVKKLPFNFAESAMGRAAGDNAFLEDL